MAYQSLYRTHRPRTFADVVGQEHVTRTLVNAITEDRLHHAYLFTGQRGTGKTSTARILAAAVNCEQGPTPDPCGTCEQCTSIVAGRNVDVIELDMASHGGVDDARELRDRAVFAPAAARKKVYILDEVHMASTAAFNALLKVVEEPPPHVLFAMATTDPHKVLPTILSRVQRLDLRRIPGPVLTAHLRDIGAQEGFELDDEAAAGVVAAGDGSARDTLSVLEQVLSFAADAGARDGGVLHVTGDHVTTVLGATPFAMVVEVVDRIADADVAGALTAIQGLLDAGHDLRRFTMDLATHLRDLLVLAAAPQAQGLVDATAERLERMAAQAQRFGTDSLVRGVGLLGEVLAEQRQGPPRLPLELAVARLATPGADGDLLALADRVARLEKAVAGGDVAPAPPSTPVTAPAVARAEPPVEQAPAAPAPVVEPPTEVVPPAAAEPAVEEAAVVAPVAPVVAEPAVEEPAPVEPPVEELAAPVEASVAPATEELAAPDAAPTAVEEALAPATEELAAPDATSGEAAALAERARELAETAGPLVEPEDLSLRPGTTTVAHEPAAPAPGGDELALVVDRWEAILTVVGDLSRRAKAFYEPGTPVRLGNGVLLLRYPSSRRFHAEQAKSGEMTAHLAEAIEQATGLARVRVDVQLSDDPTPAPVARVVADPEDRDEPAAAEIAAVAEVEQAPAAPVDEADVDDLIRRELGGQPLAEDEL